jgi:hypothetical protein
MAPNNRQLRRRIASLQRRILEHERYIEAEPTSRAAGHWVKEIEAWKSEIRRLKRRLET